MVHAAPPPQPLWSGHIPQGRGLPVPGPVHGPYPMRDPPQVPPSATWAWCRARWRTPLAPSRRATRRCVASVRGEAALWARLAPPERAVALVQVRRALAADGLQGPALAAAMGACVAEIEAGLGWQLHDVQIAAAWWMLGHRLVEMATGEGKSVTVVLAAAAAALAGVPVHVMTSNDYLARRDAAQWQPIFASVGLSVASVLADSAPPARQAAYRCDVVYVTAREVAFDYLRDRAARDGGRLHELVLRGLCMALIDEADSILIDEACTPLLLSQASPDKQQAQHGRLALYLARQLQPGVHYKQRGAQQFDLSPQGKEHLASLCFNHGGAWRLQRHREDQVGLALTALHGLARDVDYLVLQDEVQIIDGTTGRLAQGRVWSRGLHQMLCIKEGVSLAAAAETLSQTTYQTFFPRYHRLGGLSGTLWEERGELLAIYGLPVMRAPSRFPASRVDGGTRIWPTAQARWQAVAERAQAVASTGRAVLVGTDSVASSEALSQLLQQRGVPHALLNARLDAPEGAQERAVVEAAGRTGAITVATHMAGRGTDIHLDAQVLARGGLHVINTHLNASARIDRQLLGRCGRQGQPGSYERMLTWADSVWRTWVVRPWFRRLVMAAWPVPGVQPALVRLACALVQRQQGAQWRWQRWGLLQLAVAMRRQLALAGRDE